MYLIRYFSRLFLSRERVALSDIENLKLAENLNEVRRLFLGGDGVAFAPENNSQKFRVEKGDTPVERLIAHFKETFEGSNAKRTFLFLVGGPGNGKSFFFASDKSK